MNNMDLDSRIRGRFRQFCSGFSKGMNSFGKGISSIVNSILLSAVYLIGVGLTSIFSKIARKHFLQRKINKNKQSYWSDLNLKKKPIEEYYRQF